MIKSTLYNKQPSTPFHMGSLILLGIHMCISGGPGSYKKAPPWGLTSNPFVNDTIFNRKGTPFEYLILTNGTLFIHLLRTLIASLSTAVNE